jgi:hypothetical protein
MGTVTKDVPTKVAIAAPIDDQLAISGTNKITSKTSAAAATARRNLKSCLLRRTDTYGLHNIDIPAEKANILKVFIASGYFPPSTIGINI